MKKRNFKSLSLKKKTISKLDSNRITGEGASTTGPTCVYITIFVCPSVGCSEGTCGSIP
ncbi:hypothetical protein [Kordia sp.]|uniref:hypothetical protein n=1 Tax=Kordia sp. TaxID=1965332 RepID=UPI003D6A45D7